MAVLLTALAACNDAPSFPGSTGDLEDLGRLVVEALNEGDEEALATVRLTEFEHNEVVYPELPAAAGDNPFPVDLAWQNIELRSRRAVNRLQTDLAPLSPMEFESVECRGETHVFESFQVRTDCYTRFRAGGSVYEVQLFKDVLERGGGYKIFRYYDESPRRVAD